MTFPVECSYRAMLQQWWLLVRNSCSTVSYKPRLYLRTGKGLDLCSQEPRYGTLNTRHVKLPRRSDSTQPFLSKVKHPSRHIIIPPHKFLTLLFHHCINPIVQGWWV
uniref:Uncharacterized protein n=1 Tax=Anguilla anguilla TaxID=7936 RepID=A0A0E9W7R6_ANGAN